MKYLFIFNDSPYCSQRSFNGLRLANSLAKGGAQDVAVFLFGDGVVCGVARQNPADTSYNVAEMLRLIAANGVMVKACKTCLEARGIDDNALTAGVRRSTLGDLAEMTADAAKVFTF